MFDVVNAVLVQMSRNHEHVSLLKGLSIILQGLNIFSSQIVCFATQQIGS
jgi:hypothetical protein